MPVADPIWKRRCHGRRSPALSAPPLPVPLPIWEWRGSEKECHCEGKYRPENRPNKPQRTTTRRRTYTVSKSRLPSPQFLDKKQALPGVVIMIPLPFALVEVPTSTFITFGITVTSTLQGGY